jgi:hypothetical protein
MVVRQSHGGEWLKGLRQCSGYARMDLCWQPLPHRH